MNTDKFNLNENKIKVINFSDQEDKYLSLLYGLYDALSYKPSNRLICRKYTNNQLLRWLKFNSHDVCCLHNIYCYPQKETILFLTSQIRNNIHGIFTSKEQLEQIKVSSYPDVNVYVIFSDDTIEILRYWVGSSKLKVMRVKSSKNYAEANNEIVCWSNDISSFYQLNDLDEELLDYMESTYIMNYKLANQDTSEIFDKSI